MTPDLHATIRRLADSLAARLEKNAAEAAADAPPETAIPSPWEPGTDIPRALELGGYDPAIAGSDFPRLVEAAGAMRSRALRGLVLHGPAGSGKTLAAGILARGLLAKAWPGLGEFSPPTVVQPCRVDCAALSALSPDDRAALVAARHHAYLVDDLGQDVPIAHYGTVVDTVSALLSSLRPHHRLIVTTNLDPASVRARYGDRILSRLSDHIGWVRFESGDHRVSTIRFF